MDFDTNLAQAVQICFVIKKEAFMKAGIENTIYYIVLLKL